MRDVTLLDRFRGCLLGHALGDALGAPFEGLSSETLFRDYGPVDRIFVEPPAPALVYSDDTEMTASVAECLIERGQIEPDDLAQRFCRNFNPLRGYGPGMRKIAEAMNTGQDWKSLVETIFPGGSLGNGAAMRVAPVGLYFHHDLETAAEQAAMSAAVTHCHPLGMDGAVIMATAVALLMQSTRPFNRRDFFQQLSERASTEEFEWQLRTAGKMKADDSLTFGNSLEAHRSVTSALLCFAAWPDSYPNAIARAIGMGNDTDTLAAMTGALSGAYLGIEAVPTASLLLLENTARGRDFIDQSARRLYDRWMLQNQQG